MTWAEFLLKGRFTNFVHKLNGVNTEVVTFYNLIYIQ